MQTLGVHGVLDTPHPQPPSPESWLPLVQCLGQTDPTFGGGGAWHITHPRWTRSLPVICSVPPPSATLEAGLKASAAWRAAFHRVNVLKTWEVLSL